MDNLNPTNQIQYKTSKYFKDVSLNKDHEANTFINKFYVQHETEPPIDTKKTINLQKS